MMVTQCSIINSRGLAVDENRNPFVWQRTERVELHLGECGAFYRPAFQSYSNNLK